jgi:hypothetical protein
MTKGKAPERRKFKAPERRKFNAPELRYYGNFADFCCTYRLYMLLYGNVLLVDVPDEIVEKLKQEMGI